MLPYSIYLELGLTGLKPTRTVLQLADKSLRYLRGVLEDILVRVDKFCFPVDFVVLETQPHTPSIKVVSIILGRPFFATTNALINCQDGILKISCGDLITELNIFHTARYPSHYDEEMRGIEYIDPAIEKTCQ